MDTLKYMNSIEEKYIELAMNHGKLMKLKEVNDLNLEDLLNNENESVKLWSAVFLLEKENKKAIETLREIKNNESSMSSTAMIMLDIWKKGML